MTLTRLTHEPIDPLQAERSVADPAHGAVLLFLGLVRNHHQGRAVDRITYSAYPAMAEPRLTSICEELGAELGATVCVIHRLGTIEIGEASVVIASSSAHREACYEANRRCLERLKAEVPIWKREHYSDGSKAWREEESLL